MSCDVLMLFKWLDLNVKIFAKCCFVVLRQVNMSQEAVSRIETIFNK